MVVGVAVICDGKWIWQPSSDISLDESLAVEARADALSKATADECLKKHNALRSLHSNTKPLQWDQGLAKVAQAWADHMLSENSLHHKKNNKYGENLAWGWASTGPKSCASAVQDWYDESNDYDYATGKGHPAGNGYKTTGHFTQVVWKDTKKVGMGIAYETVDGYTTTFIVAEYFPPGNSVMMYYGEDPSAAAKRVYTSEVGELISSADTYNEDELEKARLYERERQYDNVEIVFEKPYGTGIAEKKDFDDAASEKKDGPPNLHRPRDGIQGRFGSSTSDTV